MPPDGGGSSDSGDEPEEPELPFEKLIDDSQLKSCMKSLMTGIKNLNNGMAWVIQKFAGTTPGYNWEMKDGGTLGQNENALTSNLYNSVR